MPEKIVSQLLNYAPSVILGLTIIFFLVMSAFMEFHWKKYEIGIITKFVIRALYYVVGLSLLAVLGLMAFKLI